VCCERRSRKRHLRSRHRYFGIDSYDSVMEYLFRFFLHSFFASAVFFAFGAGGLYVSVTFTRLYLIHEWYCILNLILKNIVFKISTQNRCVQEIEKKFDGQMEVCYIGFCTCDYLAGFRKM
jgi:hypothetical protein